MTDFKTRLIALIEAAVPELQGRVQAGLSLIHI